MSRSISQPVRAILAGIVVLVLSGSAVFAAQPTQTSLEGLATAAEHSGREVPAGPDAPTVETEDQPDEDRDAAAPEQDTEGAEGDADAAVEGEGEHCVDPATLTPEILAETNHGAIVCWAAQQETPAGYDNHGEWVSEWAKANHGSELKGARSTKGKGKAH
jgi:hypothetical protein